MATDGRTGGSYLVGFLLGFFGFFAAFILGALFDRWVMTR